MTSQHVDPVVLPPELDPRRGGSRGGGGPRPGKRLPLVVASVASVLVLVISGAGWFALDSVDRRLNRVDVGITGNHSPLADSAQNILVVGSDNRQGLTKKEAKALHVGTGNSQNGAGRRSDTMILMHLSKDRDEVSMISLPRDSYVRIPAWTDTQGKRHAAENNKLNAAFAYGGPPLTIDTIEANTGVHIDHYVEVDFTGFVSMVEALGGVDICVNQAIHDQNTGLDLPKGHSTINGAEALSFVRAREFDPRADIGRIERQQQFLGAMFRKATQSGILLNPARLTSFVDATLSAVTTDKGLTRDDVVALAARMRQVAAGDVVFLTVPVADYDYRDGRHGSSLLWDKSAATALFSKISADQPVVAPRPTGKATQLTVAPGQVSVQVLNGAGITGLARRAADDLAHVGFAISGQPTNAATTGATQTIVAYDPTQADAARTVQAALAGSALKAVPGQGEVIQVILGSDYDGATTPAVSAKPTTKRGDVRTAANLKCR